MPYAVGVLLPYVANGLHHRPPGVTLYAYDMSTLWPYDTALGGVVSFVAIVGIPMFPFVTVGVAVWSVFNLWDARGELPRRDVAWAADEERELPSETGQHRGRRQQRDPCCRQLDRQRQPLQPPTDLCYHVGVLGAQAEPVQP